MNFLRHWTHFAHDHLIGILTVASHYVAQIERLLKEKSIKTYYECSFVRF